MTYSAHDMAQASADGFRSGVASVAAQPQGVSELDTYDAGLLNDFGGGDVNWWQDYIRAELSRAHDYYQSQLVTTPPPAELGEG